MHLLSAWFQHFCLKIRRWQRKTIAYLLLAIFGISIAVVPVQAQSLAPNEGGGKRENTENWLQESRILYQQGDYNSAIAILQNQIAEFTTAGDNLKGAIANIHLSLVYQQKGEWEAAKNAIEQSDTLLQTFGVDRAPQTFAYLLEVRGKLYLAIGVPEKALEDLQQAAQFYARSQQDSALLRCQIQQSLALQALGQYRAMLELLLPLAKTIVNPNFPKSHLKVLALQNLGEVAGLAGDREMLESALGAFLPQWEGNTKRTEIDIAEWLLQESLTIAQQLDLRQAMAESYLKLGKLQHTAYRRAKDAFERAQTQNNNLEAQAKSKDAALDYFRKAREIALSPLTQAQAYLNLLNFLIEFEKRPEDKLNVAEATQQLNTLLQEMETVQSRLSELPIQHNTLQARINLATRLMEKDAARYFPTIESLLQEAQTEAESLGDSKLQAYAGGYLGKLYQTRSNLDRAFELTEQAILYSGEAQANEILYQWEWQQGRLYAAQNSLKEAIVTYEETMKTLDDVRYELLSLKKSDVNFTFRDNVEPVYREYMDLLFREIDSIKSDKSQGRLAQDDLKKVRQTLEKLQLAELEDYLRCRVQQNNTLRLDEAIDKQQLNAATIHVSVAGDRVETIVKFPEKPELRRYTTSISQQELQTLVDKTHDYLKRDSYVEGNPLLKKLYELIFQQVESDLKNSPVKTLVFILDNPFRGLPMSALYDGQKFLVEKDYSLAFNLGLDYPDSEPLILDHPQVLLAGIALQNGRYEPLPEVDNFFEVMKNTLSLSARIIRNEAFNSETLQKVLDEQYFPIVHLATHGQFSSSADETFILGWQEEKLGLMQLSQYFERPDRPIKLLVLDACQTAVGDRRAVLGIAGVSLRAGARSTVASLATIPDDSTTILMETFYRELSQSKATKAEALRRAQLTLLQDKRYRNPYYWSPYILAGNWN